jgi:hypothetical protein
MQGMQNAQDGPTGLAHCCCCCLLQGAVLLLQLPALRLHGAAVRGSMTIMQPVANAIHAASSDWKRAGGTYLYCRHVSA